jgi:hypothetical protein
MASPWNFAAAMNAEKQARTRLANAQRAALGTYGPAYGPHTGTRSAAFYASPQGRAARHSHLVAVGPVVAARHNVRNRSANVNALARRLTTAYHWPGLASVGQARQAAESILHMARSGNAAAVNALYRNLPKNLVLEIMQYVRQ